MNKKVLTVILIIALFIPTFVAVGYYSSKLSGPTSSSDVKELRIKDLDGEEWQFTSGDENTDSAAMIDLFFGMSSHAEKVAALPQALADGGFFLVTFAGTGSEQNYQFYFTENPNEAFYADGSGENVYKIAYEDAASFLKMTKYSASVFPDHELPTLLVGGKDGTTISPSSSAEWYYTMFDGEAAVIDTTPYLSDGDDVCRIDGGFDLAFSEAPDYVSLILANEEGEIYNDTLENMDQLSLGGTKEFTATVNAEWYKNENRNFYGKATYTFKGQVVEPATFYLGQTTVSNGGVIVIGGKNVSDPSKITFTSEPSINYTPTFYSEGEYVYALVPISYELEDGSDKTYTFSISYGGNTQEMHLTVTSYKYKASSSTISKAVEGATYTEEARAEAESALHELAKTEKLTAHAFDGAFLRDVVGPDSESRISPGFGRMITVTATGTKFRHTGCDYNVKKGTEVYAVNSGEVVYSGFLTTTGYIVVVDHGWGLKSWYCHLSECKVKVGDTVAKGDVVGLSGDTGFTAKNRTHVGLTVSDVPVCIYDLWDTGIAIPDMTSSAGSAE